MKRRDFLKLGALFVPAAYARAGEKLIDSRFLAGLVRAGGSAFSATTLSWKNRVIANGGATPSNATLTAIDTFWTGWVAAGLNAQTIALNFIAPDSIIAAHTPFIVGPGTDPWTDVGGTLLTADLTVNGIANSDGGRYMVSGVFPSAWTGVGDCGMTCYLFTSATANRDVMGVARHGPGAPTAISAKVTPNITGFGFYFECWDQNGACPDRTSNAAFSTTYTGYISCNRTSTSATGAYSGNSGSGHGTIATCSTATGFSVMMDNTYDIGFMASTASGNANFARISFCEVHHGRTSGQSSSAYTLIQALRVALGGGYV